MQYSIESIRDGIAALVGDDGTLLHLAADVLPTGAKPGDVLQQTDNGFLPLPQITAARKAHALALFRKLKRHSTH